LDVYNPNEYDTIDNLNTASVFTKPTFVQKQRGKLLPALILGFIYFYSLKPPGLYFSDVRWYIALGLAFFVYLIQRRQLDFKAARIYWIISGLILLGATLSLLNTNTQYLDASLFNLVALWVNVITFLLFITTLATRICRTVLLFSHLAASFFWTIEIQRRLADLGYFSSTTFSGVDENKNAISLLLALGITALLAFTVLWRPATRLRRGYVNMIRMLLVGAAMFMLYSQSLTYSRSELATSFVGILAVIGVAASQTRGMKKIRVIIISLIILGLFVYIALPYVTAAAPGWSRAIDPVKNLGDPTSFVTRKMLYYKGLSIIRENPLLGIGPGNTRGIYINLQGVFFERWLLHNTYLTYWAEYGLLGLLSIVAFILAYIKILNRNFHSLPMVDRIWLIMFIPWFFALNFINVGTLMMLAILTGIYYEQYQIQQSKTSPTEI